MKLRNPPFLLCRCFAFAPPSPPRLYRQFNSVLLFLFSVTPVELACPSYLEELGKDQKKTIANFLPLPMQ
jgi:hypothetical protein